MTSLAKRLFHLFEPADLERASQEIRPVQVSSPRVGQVKAVVTDESGIRHDVHLELSATRRGGMTLESRSTSRRGRAGLPCAELAAVLLEVDRRGFFSGVHEHTPIELDVLVDEDAEEEELLDVEAAASGAAENDAEFGTDAAAGDDADETEVEAYTPPITPAVELPKNRWPSGRQPAWSVDLEARRRLVEPAVRTRSFSLGDARRGGGGLVFLLDINASTESRGVLLTPARISVDVAGNATGRPKPVVIDAAAREQMDVHEKAILAELLGSTAVIDRGLSESAATAEVSRILIDESAVAPRLSWLCERGRLLFQPEPRRNPELAIPLAWDGSRPWQFSLVITPDDPPVSSEEESHLIDGSTRATPKRPAKATLDGMLSQGSQRRPLRSARAILKCGLAVFDDRLARVDLGNDVGWLEQFERRGPIELPGQHIDGLIEQLAGLANPPRLVLPSWTGWRIESGQPRPKLVLDDSPAVSTETDATGTRRRRQQRVRLAGRVWFEYGGIVVEADDPAGGVLDANARVLVLRDREAERLALAELPRFGGMSPKEPDAAHHVEIARERLDASVAQLAAVGWAVEVAGRRYRPAGSMAWHVTSGIDWFELSGSLDFGGVSVEMPALLEAIARGDRAVELSDGSMGILPDDWPGQLEPLVALAQKQDGRLRYGRMQAALLDALLASQPSIRVDEAFERIREELTSGERPHPEAEPEGFQGTLRQYQKEGLGWLVFLEKMGLGGCLADDMGLGKTIQVLAMLLRRQQQVATEGLGHRPSLVVVPKSLIFNWIEEAARFAPQLKVLNHTGAARRENTALLPEADIILTTYGTLRRDAVDHRQLEFDYVVLDEAQTIKNAGSQAAKACRLLKARHRLAVTGTPVENHIGELWSIFEFLNPGQLGTAARLRRFLAGGRGGSAADIVARAVRPYLLRRTKDQVLTDLPEKTEQTLMVELGTKQRKAYDELREHYRQELTGRISRMGISRSRIAVLEALLRLRQAACHPGLIDPAEKSEPGAKLEALLEQLDEVTDEGHKVLVFSQFTSFLAILRQHLDEKSVVYEYLDGRTTDRQARVNRFQEDPDCRLFLISLKAGGQGLNLTAADYIYILDPWWNPAVEAQAVDRAHRIGQTRPVFAYRLIARDTVEEKIVSLQARKRELAESIVRAEEGMAASLTAEDIELLFS
jgi:hypothetical protein